jgi:hypothetical protein
VTEDTEGPGRIAEGPGDFLRGATLDIERAKSLVLALLWVFGLQEKGARFC